MNTKDLKFSFMSSISEQDRKQHKLRYYSWNRLWELKRLSRLRNEVGNMKYNIFMYDTKEEKLIQELDDKVNKLYNSLKLGKFSIKKNDKYGSSIR